MCLVAIQLNAQIELVKDVLLTPTPLYEQFSHVHEVGDVVYFVAEDALWISDFEGNTTNLRTFGFAKALMNIGDRLVFVASDGVTGAELWTSDGTSEGTVVLRDISPGNPGSDPEQLTLCNGMIFFVATTPTNGKEVWRTDGTPSGTVMVKDIMKGVGHSNASFLTALGDHVYFAANDAKHGYELWRSDGTSEGTELVIDIHPGKSSSAPQHITASGGYIYFAARTEAAGEELWKSDGTAAGTTLVKDVSPGPSGSFPKWLIDADSKLYFVANDKVHGMEVWTTDGTEGGTILIKDLNPGVYSGIRWFEAVAGNSGFLYFIQGGELYASDGTAEGTIVIRDRVGDSYTPIEMFEFGDALYFIAKWNTGLRQDGTFSSDLFLTKLDGGAVTNVKKFGPFPDYITYEISGTSALFFIAPEASGDNVIWRSDGTDEGTKPFVNIVTYTEGASPENFVNFNHKVYFTTNTVSAFNGLWVTDGTESGTEEIVSGFVTGLVAGDDLMFFEKDFKLWKSDGTSAGTEKVSDVPVYITGAVAGNVAYFPSGTDFGEELWKSDGTLEGTVMVKDINPVGSSMPREFTVLNGTVFFSATTSEGEELWKTDGTEAGTALVKDIIPGAIGSHPRHLTVLDDQLFFVADTPGGKQALYRSDGTNTGTVVVKDFPTEPVLTISSLTESTGHLYFVVNHTGNNKSLYQTDGTTAGTRLIKTFASVSNLTLLPEYQGKTYFLISPSDNFLESLLWVTDGTDAGTMHIASVGETSLVPIDGKVFNDILYFGTETYLVRTDGTECGTFYIPKWGPYDVTYPRNLTILENKLLFAAYAPPVGIELFSMDASAAPTSDCEELAGMLRASENFNSNDEPDAAKGTFVAYPNPFTSEFQLSVDKDQSDSFDVVIYSFDGQVKARYEGLRADQKHMLGENLGRGLYFIRISSEGKSETRRLVKQ